MGEDKKKEFAAFDFVPLPGISFNQQRKGEQKRLSCMQSDVLIALTTQKANHDLNFEA